MAFRGQDLYGDLGTMLDAGLSITKALRVSVRNSRGQLRQALLATVDGIENGLTLSESMRGSSRMFSEADISVIEAGEQSGRLAESFVVLAHWHLMKSRTWNAIRSGLARPFLELHAAAFIVPIPAVVLGRITLIQYLASVVSVLFVLLYIPLGVVRGICRASGMQGRFRRPLDSMLLKVPLLGPALRDMALARYGGSLFALYNAGVAMPRCAQHAAELCGNAAIAAMLEGGAKSAQEGHPVSDGFSTQLPFDFLQPWKVAEEAGRVAETLQRLSVQRQEQAERNLRDFARWALRICMFIVMFFLAWLILGARIR